MKKIKYFTAKWCGPCKRFKPVMEEISRDGYDVEFIDVDENTLESSKYGITSVPAVMIFENDKPKTLFFGYQEKNKIIEKLQ